MLIRTAFPEELGPGYLSWYVKCYLQGSAVGIYPAFLWRWRLPPLYQAGVQWQLEPQHGSGVEEFALPTTVYRRGWGDCDDLVVWYLCESWKRQGLHPLHVLSAMAAGTAARVRTIWDGYELHVLIRMPDGSEEDPSERLGAE